MTDQHQARREALVAVVDRLVDRYPSVGEGGLADELERALVDAHITLTPDQREHVLTRVADGEPVDVDALEADAEGGGPA